VFVQVGRGSVHPLGDVVELGSNNPIFIRVTD
jgi:hypothetical protein